MEKKGFIVGDNPTYEGTGQLDTRLATNGNRLNTEDSLLKTGDASHYYEYIAHSSIRTIGEVNGYRTGGEHRVPRHLSQHCATTERSATNHTCEEEDFSDSHNYEYVTVWRDHGDDAAESSGSFMAGCG